MNYPIGLLGTLTTHLGSGISRPFFDRPDGRPVLRSTNLKAGKIDLDEIKFWHSKDPRGANLDLVSPIPGDMLVNFVNGSSRELGKAAMFRGEPQNCIVTTNIFIVRFDRSRIEPEFANYFFQSDIYRKWLHLNAGFSGQGSFNKADFSQLELPCPDLRNQKKIIQILQTWDEALSKHASLRKQKARRIASVRQRLFEAEYASHNRLQRAKDLFETVSERARPDLPLLAVMQDIGIVRRDELDRRVAMPDGDTSTYKVVRPGDFVISLRSFEGGLEYSSIIGLVSPAYTVLRPTTDLIGDYYRHFFKSRSFIGRLDKLIFGIRDGKQIAFRDFGDMYIPAPPVAEQEARARALGSLEADLALEDDRIAALTRQKRGLMQKLLTGEWRVNTTEATEVAQ